MKQNFHLFTLVCLSRVPIKGETEILDAVFFVYLAQGFSSKFKVCFCLRVGVSGGIQGLFFCCFFFLRDH